MKKKVLLWFTQDLRVQDNPLIHWASQNACETMAMAFIPAEVSNFQKQFYIDSALELKKQMQSKGLSLFLMKADPKQEIPIWAELNSIDLVLTQDPFNSRGKKLLTDLAEKIGPHKLKTFTSQTLVNPDKIPFAVQDLPLIFSNFRKLVEKADCFASNLESNLNSLVGFKPIIPATSQFLEVTKFDSTSYPFDLQPGESGAHQRVKEYFWETKSLSHYKETRNGMLKKNDSSKLSLGLGCGCISARQIYCEIKKFENDFSKNESTDWFILELLWRDYFKFLALKIGDKLFSVNGISGAQKEWSSDELALKDWCEGQTGADFIDANMNELKKTGWMSNRGRQNVASYLAKTLKINWTLGAQYFEKMLIDNDTESNWGNWLYVSGVGTDPRDRIFNYKKQAEMYDSGGAYRNLWLP